ncbi:MAG: hypothetical protein ACK40K_00135, partial [Raineya sp.]
RWLPELKKAIGEKDFTIIGISEAKFGIKKFITDYLKQTFAKMASYPIEIFNTIDEALSWIKKKRGL